VHPGKPTNQSTNQPICAAEGGEAIFKGRIRIPGPSYGCRADQLCRTIMLGRRAHLVALPTLEVSADDAECSHGASVCELDENSMFYLAARGLGRQVRHPGGWDLSNVFFLLLLIHVSLLYCSIQEAKKLMLQSFVLELLSDTIMVPCQFHKVLKIVPNES
jgi:hypothetical protein